MRDGLEEGGFTSTRRPEVDTDNETILLGAGHGLVAGDAVVYSNGGGDDIGGIETTKTYYVPLSAATASRSTRRPTRRATATTPSTSTRRSRPAPRTASTACSRAARRRGSRSRSLDAGGDVRILGEERIKATIVPGAASFGGTVGISGAIALASVRSPVQSFAGTGASITAGGDVELKATARNTAAARAFAPNLGSTAALTFSYARNGSFALAEVRAGATIDATNVDVVAQNINAFTTTASSFGFENTGALGFSASLAVTDHISAATARVLGTITAAGDVLVDARSVNNKTITRAGRRSPSRCRTSSARSATSRRPPRARRTRRSPTTRSRPRARAARSRSALRRSSPTA